MAFFFYGGKMTMDYSKALSNSDMAKLERAATECQYSIAECNTKFTKVLTQYNGCVWNMTGKDYQERNENPNSFIDKLIKLD